MTFCLCLRAHSLQHYDGPKTSRISSGPLPSDSRQHGYMSMLDELTLEHMTQDCSSLKNQLLRLKTLLQVRPTFAKRCEWIQMCMLACAKTCTHTYACTHSTAHICVCRNMHKCIQHALSARLEIRHLRGKTTWPLKRSNFRGHRGQMPGTKSIK